MPAPDPSDGEDRSPTVQLVDLAAGPAELDRASTLLSTDEARRAAAYHRPPVRDQYVAAHAALRLILAPLVGRSAAQLRFDQAPCPLCGEAHGRPRLDPTWAAARPGASAVPHFSLTRRPGLAAVAVADRPVGVDLEALDRVLGPDDLAAALHPREVEQLDRCPPDKRRWRVHRIWTRKEAYLKALGTGLGLDPATVDTTPGVLPTPPGLRVDPGTPTTWVVHDLPIDAVTPRASPRHLAAVALAGAETSAGTVRVVTHRTSLTDLLRTAG